MTFQWPWMSVSLLFLPLFVGGYIWLFRRRQHGSDHLGPLSQVQNRTGRPLGKIQHLPPMLILLGLALLLFSLTRPNMFLELPRVEGTVILTFDVSNSMNADDFEPSRMEAAKSAARTFVENQPSTVQVGVVAFSNGGLIVQPPTNQQADVLATIGRLTPQGATSLGHGIFSALNAIAGEPITIEAESLEEGSVPQLEIGSFPSAVILLFTDGENTTSPDPLEIAQVAAEAGVRIYPVGIGDPEGTILQLDGYNIQTQLNEPILQTIASMTNGAYYHTDDEDTLQDIYENVDLRLTIRGEKMEITALFAGISVLFFLTAGILSLLWFGRMPI